MATTFIPSFYLYGEPHRQVRAGFVHVESLDDRSRPSEWTIKAHSHEELTHLFVIQTGGGLMRADGIDHRFSAPCFLLVPAGTIHGFEWQEETVGSVITIANSYLLELKQQDQDLNRLFVDSTWIALTDDEAVRALRLVAELMRELSWSALGHKAAVSAATLSILIIALRHLDAGSQAMTQMNSGAALVARLRDRIEKRFRLREPIAEFAKALGVSQTALRAACSSVAGRSPAQMLDQRALLEARRALIYSTLSVAEIGFSVGIEDPAYFSRFFQRNMGISPRAYRASHSGKPST